MFKYLIKGLQAGLGVKMLDDYRRLSVRLLQIEATRFYLHGVRMARLSALGLMWVALLTGLIGLGLLLVHAAVFCLLPWTLQTKAWIGLFVGLGYVAAGWIALCRAMRETAWMEKSGAADLLEATIRHSTRK